MCLPWTRFVCTADDLSVRTMGAPVRMANERMRMADARFMCGSHERTGGTACSTGQPGLKSTLVHRASRCMMAHRTDNKQDEKKKGQHPFKAFCPGATRGHTTKMRMQKKKNMQKAREVAGGQAGPVQRHPKKSSTRTRSAARRRPTRHRPHNSRQQGRQPSRDTHRSISRAATRRGCARRPTRTRVRARAAGQSAVLLRHPTGVPRPDLHPAAATHTDGPASVVALPSGGCKRAAHPRDPLRLGDPARPRAWRKW